MQIAEAKSFFLMVFLFIVPGDEQRARRKTRNRQF